MPRSYLTLALGLALPAAYSCTDRNVREDRPRPDVEGLCQPFCERVHECGSPAQDSVDECSELCIGLRDWDDPDCVDARESIYLCVNEYECPEFTNHFICGDDTIPDHECCPEMNALAACRGG